MRGITVIAALLLMNIPYNNPRQANDEQKIVAYQIDNISYLQWFIDDRSRVDYIIHLILIGDFHLDRPIRIGPRNSPVVVTTDINNPASLISSGHTRAIEVIDSKGVTIENLVLSGFRGDAVFVKDSARVTLHGLKVEDSKASAWSQAAIHLTGSVTQSVIDSNIVDGSDAAGILVDTDSQSDISGLRITGNIVRNTCRKVADCGAIHVNDRGRRSVDIAIERNEISGFGPAESKGRAIYLDDWASHVRVRHNRIAGPGVFAFQIHGGHHNLIERNVVDMKAIREAVLYHPRDDGSWKDMNDNRIAYNRFYHRPADSRELFGGRIIPPVAQPLLLKNWACSARCVELQQAATSASRTK